MSRPKSRQIKVWCETCGYTLRASKRWLMTAFPMCPACNRSMCSEIDSVFEEGRESQLERARKQTELNLKRGPYGRL